MGRGGWTGRGRRVEGGGGIERGQGLRVQGEIMTSKSNLATVRGGDKLGSEREQFTGPIAEEDK